MDKQIDKATIRRRQLRAALPWMAGAAAVVCALIWLLSSLEKSVKERDIRIGTVDRGAIETTINASGRVVPAYEEIITSPVESSLIQCFVRSGDSVSAGTPLLELDLESANTNFEKMLDTYQVMQHELRQLQLNNKTALSELAMQIKVKEMEVSQLEVQVQNERHLDSLGSGTGERVRQAETQLSTTRLELKQLNQRHNNERLRSESAEEIQRLQLSSYEKDLAMTRRTLAQSRIPAPHSGCVTFILTDIGSKILPGQKVAVVSDLSAFTIEGEVPEGNSERVKVGAPVLVRVGKQELQGMVESVTPQSNAGAVGLRVSLDDPRVKGLRSGLRADLFISYGYKDDVVRVPQGSFFKGPGEYQMFVLDSDSHLTRRHVKLGDSNRQYIEVISGLEPGDRVVVNDMENYRNSTNLKISK
ncbi:MAG: efflux RND transporter periplasmic adaptor subunit [Muribaculaceae bacterium]|nr:efflux RND transporter periplasmic adaptor subunit [Muribaculaceae bacterium]MDE6331959.1 efflux RND transporter periplasmic adaptor subunit [Muribaculaceae bacterium]